MKCNILINGDGRAVITDFGLAKVKGEISEYTDKQSSMLAGSTRWMAPELSEGGETPVRITKESDVWAFAMTILEVITPGSFRLPIGR